MRAYSEDLRERIVEAVMEGLSKAEVARQYKVNRSTVYAYLKRHEAGDLSAKPRPGRSYKLSSDQVEALRQQTEAHPELTLLEHAELFEAEHGVKLAFSTVNLYFKRLGFSAKKRASMRKGGAKQTEPNR